MVLFLKNLIFSSLLISGESRIIGRAIFPSKTVIKFFQKPRVIIYCGKQGLIEHGGSYAIIIPKFCCNEINLPPPPQ